MKRGKEIVKMDVVIPTYRPDNRFVALMERLQQQSFPIGKIIVIDTDCGSFPAVFPKAPYPVEVVRIGNREFDHGGTRNRGARLSEADIVLYMTQDAVPADRNLTAELMRVFAAYPDVDVAYGRQLPEKGCSSIERFARQFNYPPEGRVKSLSDRGELGIKTFFCSNVCGAYRRKKLLEMGGFPERIIFNEDMVFAGRYVMAGGKIAYVPQAKVIHSHNYTAVQQFRRYFDLAVSQAEHPEVFADVSSEGEGIRLVVQTAKYLLKRRKPGQFLYLPFYSGCKYLGYWLGKRYRKLPGACILRFTANRRYWEI